ncbi:MULTISPECIES: DUF6113 family protein [Streptomyces]|uniref:Integral membrane protein n=1 Tax=Streptomyces thermoviolaceus subsp. thermoviolaceus TaxID=66860 RepID=A0ABX0YS60_STRTL|nr:MULTISPECIES: DUF6113 family protein [Streptomyces]MCM3262939.1 DUF6113 family protein [Streptomyces thermoviolaceus]NJP15204.1 hypothetical protein [Streptomyces thermoviolaceus subsp. thermoviolaceus]RSS07696.1 hypothetical protein EF917_04055 [Streptomyces sp. WAC00469]WTD47583.1 DUF6113 family protein [Streptomyces thermoviolaceus]GGV75268.1 hypothetical protein GCM10010499_31160 [Streptomyces thermoviolaceus subsp. apingens]
MTSAGRGPQRRPASPPPQGPLPVQPLKPPSPGRAAAYLGLFVLGAVVGAAGALVQAAWFPGGLLLALAGAAGLFLGGTQALRSRGGAVAGAAGWLIAVLLLTASRPEGDFLFAAGAGSYLFLLGGMAVAVVCATFGRVRQPDAPDARLGE